MEKIKVNVVEREKSTKGFLRSMRQKGYIPGVLYGANIKPKHLFINKKEFLSLVRAHREKSIFELKFEENKKAVPSIIKEEQIDPIKKEFLHIDFVKISLDKMITTKIPIHSAGIAIGIKHGGILDQTLHELEIEALPESIPPIIEIDVSNLEVGHAIHVKDIKVEEGIKIITPDTTAVFSVLIPKEEVVTPPPAEAAEVTATAEETTTGGTEKTS